MNGRVYLLIIILFTILMVVFIYFIIQNQRLYAIKSRLDHFHLLASNCQWIFLNMTVKPKHLPVLISGSI